jgi:hypothetical protein
MYRCSGVEKQTAQMEDEKSLASLFQPNDILASEVMI